MLVDKTEGKLGKIREFAEKQGKLGEFQKLLDYLDNYSSQPVRCTLYRDWAPMSLTFTIERQEELGAPKDREQRWAHWFNGGLIYHGSHDGYGSGSAPTLSVTVGPTDGWSIHT